MKFLKLFGGKKPHYFLKTCRRMKIGLFLLLVVLFQLKAENSYSQVASLSLSLKNITIEQVLDRIEEESDFHFLVVDNSLDMTKLVNINVNKRNITDVLNELFKSTDVKYQIVDRQIILSKKEVPGISQQKNLPIKGSVVDETGMPVIGANIYIKGTTNGTITDVDGNFNLEVPENAVLSVSYIGYLSKDVKVGKDKIVSIMLSEDTQKLDEVVVIGFGTQKKINLTGSVASISAEELAERPQPNVQNMLQGKVAGMQIVSNTAQPGKDGGMIAIRGKGSFGASSDPLILVDGVPGELSTIAAEDVESVSVLKDAASASIYGARAANGVILVTTKKGKQGKAQISYNFSYGWQQATGLGDQIWDSATYMELYNQMADRMGGGRTKYSQDLIDKYKDPNRDMNRFPDYNWMEETFKTGHEMNHNLGVSGGTDKLTYNISLGYLNQEGLLDAHSYDRYTGLMNIEAKIHDWIKVGATANFYNGVTKEPWHTNEQIVLLVASSRPMAKPYLPDGSGRYSYLSNPEAYGGEWQNRNPVWNMNESSRKYENWRANGQLYIDIDFLKKQDMKLTWSTKGGFRYSDQFMQEHQSPTDGYYYLKESDYKAGGRDEYILATDFFPGSTGNVNKDERTVYTMFYTTLNFDWTYLKDHSLNAMLGYQDEGNNYRYLQGSRINYPSYSMTELDGGSTNGQTLAGGLKQFALRSFFGRLNYAYKSKYLVEANFRYDGTSRIYKDNRWGIFPSFSGAWRISEESFVKDNVSWVDNLKLRASWGKLGNSEIGEYPYQEVYSATQYIFNNAIQQGVVQNALKDKSLKWETTAVTDVGVDLSLFRGMFSLTFDWYNKITDGILSQAAIPLSVGMDAPTINYGKLRNRGVEFEVGHQNKIGDFSYGASFMASLNKNEVLELRAPSYGDYIYEVGKPYGEHYLYIWDGIFQSEEDIANSPVHPNSPKPGDIKFKDLNGDNKIDSKDRQMVEGVYPKMLYSFNLNFGYKNFDLSAFFQGISGRKIWTNFFGEDPFSQGQSPNKKFLNAWTPENTNTDVPAIYSWGYAPMCGTRSTYNLKDASYLRLKNLQIGYNVPKALLGKMGIDYLRIYFSGENLLTFTSYPDYDPERAGDGWHVQYPQAKTYSIGLNVKF